MVETNTGHGVTYHGGFSVRDEVEYRDPFTFNWIKDTLKIQRFDGMSVLIGNDKYSVVCNVSDIRHPKFVKEAK